VPGQLTPAELKADRAGRARDLRGARLSRRRPRRSAHDATGEIYVIEVNPLPGLTPGYSDLCLIATAAGIDYRTLIGEILAGGLKRLREKRRADARERPTSKAPPAEKTPSGRF
jgi:hypothetical protein